MTRRLKILLALTTFLTTASFGFPFNKQKLPNEVAD